MHQKRILYHIFAGILLIVAGLVLAATYGIEDLYHLLKYGPENYLKGYNIFRPELWIKPSLFLFSGIFYLKRKKYLLLLCVPVVLLLYVNNYDDIIWSSYYRTLVLSELLAFAGFLALRLSGRLPGPLYRILPVNLEMLSILSSIRNTMSREYLVRIVSGIAYTLYKFPLLIAYILMEMELSQPERRTGNGKQTA